MDSVTDPTLLLPLMYDSGFFFHRDSEFKEESDLQTQDIPCSMFIEHIRVWFPLTQVSNSIKLPGVLYSLILLYRITLFSDS